ncbi:MAG: hypothetical protein ABIC91_02960 [Nanoarchaeota archaeon]|nr:hypothetical protein [Nanoarchaeota archaeon]MBU1030550.1 hypothetical protein [Nanoarchaeota archaeon]MBU1850543.1 hypothetical protein [Nanoarchaeota archaeon]
MTVLIACLSTGKGTWGHVASLINAEDWDKIFLITNDFGKEKFTSTKPAEFICIDSNKETLVLQNELIDKLKGKILDTEVALNMFSGSGKEHMVLLSAILKLGLGIRLVLVSNSGVGEL